MDEEWEWGLPHFSCLLQRQPSSDRLSQIPLGLKVLTESERPYYLLSALFVSYLSSPSIRVVDLVVILLLQCKHKAVAKEKKVNADV